MTNSPNLTERKQTSDMMGKLPVLLPTWLVLRWQGWRSGESTCLPPIWPEFDFRTRGQMWIEFVGSLLCHEGFSRGTRIFPSHQKPTFDLI